MRVAASQPQFFYRRKPNLPNVEPETPSLRWRGQWAEQTRTGHPEITIRLNSETRLFRYLQLKAIDPAEPQ